MTPGDNNFESEFTFENAAVPASEELPFHVLILGDWSGNADRKDLSKRSLVEIDRDNFDEILNRLNVSLNLDLHGDGNISLPLHFTEIDDFHPDNLFRNVSLFSDLRDVRRRLSKSDTFESAAAEVRSWLSLSNESLVDDAEIKSQLEDAPPIDSDNLLDMILTQPSSSNTSVKPKFVDNSDLGRFVSKIVSPHLIKIDENEQSKLIAVVDDTISELMRAILHHPEFQALESAWRSLFFLVRRIETDSTLKVFIFDVALDELVSNLKSVNDLQDSILYPHLIARSFAVIAGNYSFGLNVDDVAALIRIGELAKVSNSPFISYVKPEIFGLDDFSKPIDTARFEAAEDSKAFKLWTALRSGPEAQYIGLSPTKIFLRMPYGKASDSIETFSFEEFDEYLQSNNFLWMNPCFAITLLLSQSFSQFGWELRRFLIRSVDHLPLYIYKENGESKTVPCAEVLLTENTLEKLISHGMMPFVSFRDQSNIRLPAFQSISPDSSDLHGPWSVPQ